MEDAILSVSGRMSIGAQKRQALRMPANPFSHAFRDLFDGSAHPSSQGQNGKRRDQKDDEIPFGR